jgi:hypothetical protein
MQMFFAHMMIDTSNSAFEDRKVILDRVCMLEMGTNIFLGGMVD